MRALRGTIADELYWLSLLLNAVGSAGGIRGSAARSLDGAGAGLIVGAAPAGAIIASQ
jgi:hypothetical protein